jgi:hypothetical protein
MQARWYGVENHAGNVINHTRLDVLQRWQIYINIAPLKLVEGIRLIVVSFRIKPTAKRKQRTTYK